MSEMPKVGELAPDFELPDDQARLHRLADRRGHFTIVYFYPEDDTPGCTTEACSFRDAQADFDAAGAEIWGVSPQGAGSKAAFRAKYGLPFTLLADEDHRVAEAYGSWGERIKNGQHQWRTMRTSFLVDPDGRIAHVWPTVKPEGHAGEVLEALRAAQAARQAAPARA